ncbi:hypothetical protein, variant [Aphanomyces invadans]|uniref:Uncharacterized protein n=1 Tax=Aphanomyces invadans TaxID=157072 RepID=A0A024U8S7_9STRA|nr:hypothetical protein, variant [Aphanomyces invadans]ETW02282.1 hypothetical protein, variant [Aphanomyces invadans]|eukprot:XP_008868887.1 hypothetical protein, variant [Aphanomyces invadans]
MERPLVSAFLMCTMIYAAPLLCGSWEFLLTWDDSINFVENEVISRLDWRHFRAMLCEVRIGVYEPLAHLLKAMVFAACGLNSQCVRLITLTLHAASCYVLRQVSIDLLALLLDSLEPKATSLGCTLSAFLYFIHPLNVEVVAWPSAQPYALALFFVSMCYYVHVANWSRPGIKASSTYALARRLLPTVLYGCAVLSKSVAVLAPAGLVFIDVLICLKRPSINPSLRWHVLQLLRGFFGFGVVGAMAVWAMVASNKGGDTWEADPLHIPFHECIVKAFVMISWTIRTFVWPTELRAHYSLLPGDMNFSTNSTSLLSLVACIGITMWSLSRRAVCPSALAAWTYSVIDTSTFQLWWPFHCLVLELPTRQSSA